MVRKSEFERENITNSIWSLVSFRRKLSANSSPRWSAHVSNVSNHAYKSKVRN